MIRPLLRKLIGNSGRFSPGGRALRGDLLPYFLALKALCVIAFAYILRICGRDAHRSRGRPLGLFYHTAANVHGPSSHTFDNFVYGAPALALLLLPNLAVLTFIALVTWWPRLPACVNHPLVSK
jgi:hypothetical protein